MADISDANFAPGSGWALCGFLDVLGDPVRGAISPVSLTMPGTSILRRPDADFDGKAFDALEPRMLQFGTISNQAGGGNSLSVSLRGTLEFDSGLLNLVSDPVNISGRRAAFWLVALDTNMQPVGARVLKNGAMTNVTIGSGRSEQSITITVDTYLNWLSSGAPARTIADQAYYDANDHSAEAMLGKPSSAAFGPGGNLADWAIANMPWLHF